MSTLFSDANCSERVYENAGNRPLLEMIATPPTRVLDVGCGAGDNARLIRRKYAGAQVSGITVSESEAAIARAHMRQCWVADVERDPLDFLAAETFDCLLLSHVLEHLQDPAGALRKLVAFLAPGAQVLIAVPNVLSWRYRARMLAGDFDYEDTGVFDRTHLRFYTVASAPRELVDPVHELELDRESAEGSMPLWILRRHILPKPWSRRIDAAATRLWPGMFAGQIMLRCTKR